MMNWWWWYFWSIEAKVKYIENTRYWSWSIWILKSQPKNLDTLVKKTQIRRWVGAGADHAPFTTFRTLQKSQFSAISSSKLHPISLASIKPTMATSSSSTTTISQLSCFSSLNSRRHHLHRRSILSLPQSPRYKVLKKPNLFFSFILIQQCKKLIDFYDYSHGLLWVLKDMIMKHRLQLQISKQVVRIITIQLLRNIRELVIK